MGNTASLYGHDVQLEDIDSDETITDVIVLARTVRVLDDGTITDATCVSATRQTTGIIQQGMASDMLRILTSFDA